MKSFKKIISLMICILMILSAMPGTLVFADSVTDKANILGDTNQDGVVNIKDATLIQKYAAVLVELNDRQLEAGDVNADNKVNIKDATTIQKWVAGLISESDISTEITEPTEAPTTVAPTTEAPTEVPTTAAPTDPATEDEPETVPATADEPLSIEVLDFYADKDALSYDSYEKVIFIAKIATNSTEDEFSLTAVCNDATVDEVVLADDGNYDDDIAGDNVYTGSAYLYSDKVTDIHFTIISDENVTVSGNTTLEISFYSEEEIALSKATAAEIETEIDKLSENFVYSDNATITNLDEVKDSIDECLNKFLNNGDIAGYDYNEFCISVTLPVGTFVYLFDLQEEPNGDETLATVGSSFSETKNIITIQPYANELKTPVFDNGAQKIAAAGLGYAFNTNMDNDSISVEFMKTLYKYKLVLLDSHGGYTDELHSFIGIGESYDKDYEKYPADYSEDRLIHLNSGRYGVTSKFFDHYYRNNEFKDSLIFLGCCHGADDSTLADTLIDRGAAAVLAYKNSVYTSYNRSMYTSIVEELLKVDNETGLTNTIEDAVKAAKLANGAVDPVGTSKGKNAAVLILKEDNDGKSFRLVDEMGDDNLSFESDFKYWWYSGDCRIIPSIGSLTPTHKNKAAIIGTGLGAVNDSNSTVRRSFVKTAGMSALSFDYNVVSEEPSEYVGSIYNDYMTVTLSYGDTSKEVLYESVNSSTWEYVGENYFNGGDNTTYHTGWSTCEINLEDIPVGTTFTININIADIGDSLYDTAVMLDNFVFA